MLEVARKILYSGWRMIFREKVYFKDRPFILTSRRGLKPGIFLRMWLNRLFCFLHLPSTTQGLKTHWFLFLKFYSLKVLFENLKKLFHVWDIFEGTPKSYPTLICINM